MNEPSTFRELLQRGFWTQGVHCHRCHQNVGYGLKYSTRAYVCGSCAHKADMELLPRVRRQQRLNRILGLAP